MKNIKRTLTAGILILSILLSSCTIEKVTAKIAKGNALSIVVVTDLHFLDASLFDLGPGFFKYSSAGDGRMLRYNNEIVDAFVSIYPKIKEISKDVNKTYRDRYRSLDEEPIRPIEPK